MVIYDNELYTEIISLSLVLLTRYTHTTGELLN